MLKRYKGLSDITQFLDDYKNTAMVHKTCVIHVIPVCTWDRLLLSFIHVSAVARAKVPSSRSSKTSDMQVTSTSLPPDWYTRPPVSCRNVITISCKDDEANMRMMYVVVTATKLHYEFLCLIAISLGSPHYIFQESSRELWFPCP